MRTKIIENLELELMFPTKFRILMIWKYHNWGMSNPIPDSPKVHLPSLIRGAMKPSFDGTLCKMMVTKETKAGHPKPYKA